MRSPYFLIKIFAGDRPVSRFGVIISKAVFKKAVDRNRLKRLIFDFIQKKQSGFKNGDYLIIALASASQLENRNSVFAELEKIF